MTKNEIQEGLKKNYTAFADLVSELSEANFISSANQKWSAGQQLDHLVRSIKPLAQGLMMPKIAIGTMFGKADRESISYAELVQKYQTALANGGAASGRFLPKVIEANESESLRNELLQTLDSLIKRIEKFSESDLDKYLLPHPLLGKLTLREMLMFTVYHAEHHQKSVLANLAS